MPSDRYRERLREVAGPALSTSERIVAMLPFATVPKLPKGPEGKVRFGIRQSWRRYRPLVVTDRRLLIFDSGRTPTPRALLGSFPLADVVMGPVAPARWGASHFTLILPGAGEVPFETGSREVDDLAVLRQRAVAAVHG